MEWTKKLVFDTEIVDCVLEDALGLPKHFLTEEQKRDYWEGAAESAWEEFFDKLYDSLRSTLAEEYFDKLPDDVKSKYTY